MFPPSTEALFYMQRRGPVDHKIALVVGESDARFWVLRSLEDKRAKEEVAKLRHIRTAVRHHFGSIRDVDIDQAVLELHMAELVLVDRPTGGYINALGVRGFLKRYADCYQGTKRWADQLKELVQEATG